MKAKTYYYLVVQYSKGDEWAIEFGDYDKDCVIFEKEVTTAYKKRIVKCLDNDTFKTVLSLIN